MSLRLDALPSITPAPYDGVAYRQQSAGHDPRSGAGARRAGGRFNPPASFPVLYLCLTPVCCVAELGQAARSLGVGVSDLLPREFYSYELSLSRVLDLRDQNTRRDLNADLGSLLDVTRTSARELGAEAFRTEWQAIVCPSRTGVGDVMAVFPEHLSGAIGEVTLTTVWRSQEDLPGYTASIC